MFLASIERRSSRQSKDVLRVNRNNVRKTNAKEDPSSIIKINMDETPGRGKQSKIKIATVFHYDESLKATHYHILPAAENSMLPALTAPIWSQQNGGEKTVSEREKYSSLKDYGKIPLQRLRPSASKKRLASKTRLRLQSPRLYMQWTNMRLFNKISFLETQFNGRTYSRPETHSPRADCARFMPRFRYLRVPAACAGALSAPRQGGSSSVEPSERERDASATRHCESALFRGGNGAPKPPNQAKCTKAIPACTAGCRPASRWLPHKLRCVKGYLKIKTIRKETLGLQMPRQHA